MPCQVRIKSFSFPPFFQSWCSIPALFVFLEPPRFLFGDFNLWNLIEMVAIGCDEYPMPWKGGNPEIKASSPMSLYDRIFCVGIFFFYLLVVFFPFDIGKGSIDRHEHRTTLTYSNDWLFSSLWYWDFRILTWRLLAQALAWWLGVWYEIWEQM